MTLPAMLTPLTMKSVHIELTVSCIPTNQPLKVISDNVAGAAHTLMEKYSSAKPRTSGVQSTTRKASRVNGICIARMAAAISSASPTPRQSDLAHSRMSPRP